MFHIFTIDIYTVIAEICLFIAQLPITCYNLLFTRLFAIIYFTGYLEGRDNSDLCAYFTNYDASFWAQERNHEDCNKILQRHFDSFQVYLWCVIFTFIFIYLGCYCCCIRPVIKPISRVIHSYERTSTSTSLGASSDSHSSWRSKRLRKKRESTSKEKRKRKMYIYKYTSDLSDLANHDIDSDSSSSDYYTNSN